MGRLNQGGRDAASGGGGGRFQEDVEVVGVDGAQLGVFAIDLIGVDQVDQGFFEGERSFLLGEGNLLMEVLESVFADVVASAVADHQEFSGGDAASAFSGKKDLCVDGGEGHGQFLANGVLAFERK